MHCFSCNLFIVEFKHRVSLCSSGWAHRNLSLLGLEVCTTTFDIFLFIKKKSKKTSLLGHNWHEIDCPPSPLSLLKASLWSRLASIKSQVWATALGINCIYLHYHLSFLQLVTLTHQHDQDREHTQSPASEFLWASSSPAQALVSVLSVIPSQLPLPRFTHAVCTLAVHALCLYTLVFNIP